MKIKWLFRRKESAEIYNDHAQKNVAKEINFHNYFSPLLAIRNLLSNNRYNDVLTEMQLMDEEIFRSHPKYPYYGYRRVNVANQSILRSVPSTKVPIPEDMRLSYKGTLKILETDLPNGVSLNHYFTRKSVLNQAIKVEITSIDEVIGKEALKNEKGISELYSGDVKSEIRIKNFEEPIYVKVEDIGDSISTIIDYLPLKRTDYNYEENYIEVSNRFDSDSDIIISLKTPLDEIINETIDNNTNLKMNVFMKDEKEANLSTNILCAKYMYGLCNANIIRFTDLKTRLPMIEMTNFNFNDVEKDDLLIIVEALEKLSYIESKYKIDFSVGEINNSALEEISLLVEALEETKIDIKLKKLSVNFYRDEMLKLYESERDFLDQDISLSFEDVEHSIVELWGYRFLLKRVVYLENIQLSREEIESKLKNFNHKMDLNLKFHSATSSKVSKSIFSVSKL